MNRYKIWLAVFSAGVFVWSFQWASAFGVCVGFLVFARYIRVLQVQFESNIQHLASEEARATISSIASFGGKLIAASIILVVGITAKNGSIILPLRVALLSGLVIFIFASIGAKYTNSK